MQPSSSSNIVSALQTAISPVILISGLGLLLLTMTNRLGRAIDRARALSASSGTPRPEVKAQMDVLMLRAQMLRWAILLAVVSSLCAALLVILLFINTLLGANLTDFISGLFIFCMVALIGSLLFFMRDVNLSLKALIAKLKG